MFIQVYIDQSLPQIDQLFTYEVPLKMKEEVCIGKRVLVPFGRGNRKQVAIVIDILNEISDVKKIKKIFKVLDQKPVLDQSSIELGKFMRNEYLIDYAQAFRPLLPGFAIGKIDEKFFLLEKEPPIEISRIFKENKNVLRSKMNEENLKLLSVAQSKGLVRSEFYVGERVFQKKEEYIYVTKKNNINLSEKQEKLVSYLLEKGPQKRSQIIKDLGISVSPINTLLKYGVLDKSEMMENKIKRNDDQVKLNSDQKKVVESILEENNLVHLIHGVTGSGKTEVYMELVKETLRKGNSAIVLVPEISLTPQMIYRFQKKFGNILSVLHSKLSVGEKADEWIKIRENKSKIIVGARSAIFAPVQDLGLIIIDEEQEESYDYHDALRYKTGEVAEKLARINNAKLIYGSATPSVVTYYRAKEKNEISLHLLPKRANALASTPNIEIVDMREELEKGNVSIFSSKLIDSLVENYKEGNQAILFMNRRGFSNFISCRSCGYVVKCNHCDISMTYHKRSNSLQCHYCGAIKPFPRICPECGSKYIKKFGIGTEQVEEMAKNLLPDATIYRMDRDTMQKKNSYETIFKKMKNGEIDILIGTQMLAKGLDFEKLTFVGIIAADTSLYIPDYRSQEKTYQLLTQVSGRAGRAHLPGQVVLQTYSPDNYSISLAKKEDYKRFYEREIKERETYNYPPFSRLFSLIVRSKNEASAFKVSNKWKITFEQINSLEGLSLDISEPIFLPKIKNEFSLEVRVKCPPDNYPMLLVQMKRVLYHYYRNLNEVDVRINIEID